MAKETPTNPNYFEGDDISPTALAKQMAKIAARPAYEPPLYRVDTSTCVSMNDWSEYDTLLQRPSIEELIETLMRGPDIRHSFVRATQVAFVTQRDKKGLAGVALMNYEEEYRDLEHHIYHAEPTVNVLAYGTVPKAGQINFSVLYYLAKTIIGYASHIADLLYPHQARFESSPFTPAVYLKVSENDAVPTSFAADIHTCISNIIGHLTRIEGTLPVLNGGFNERVIELDAALAPLKSRHANHALGKQIVESNALKRLNPERMGWGGSEDIYRDMRQTAIAMRRFLRSLMKGMDDSCAQLYPASSNLSPLVATHGETSDGVISLQLEHDKNIQGTVDFTPQNLRDPDPAINFSHHRKSPISDLAGALFTRVLDGKWWRAQMQ